jgi:hypothetical protein
MTFAFNKKIRYASMGTEFASHWGSSKSGQGKTQASRGYASPCAIIRRKKKTNNSNILA